MVGDEGLVVFLIYMHLGQGAGLLGVLISLGYFEPTPHLFRAKKDPTLREEKSAGSRWRQGGRR